MKKDKRERLEKGGYQLQSVAEFLNLTPEESAAIEERRDAKTEEQLAEEDFAAGLSTHCKSLEEVHAHLESLKKDYGEEWRPNE